MATKAEIKAKIQSALTLNAGVTDWDEIESYLIDDADSLLEAIYPTPITEDSAGTHVLTIPSSDFSYSMTFTKIGRQVHITGQFTSNITASSQSTPITVLAIEIGEYDTLGTCFGLAYNLSNGNILSLSIGSNQISVGGTVSSGELFSFSLTYNVTD